MKITIQDELFICMMPLYFLITRRQPGIASGKGTYWGRLILELNSWICHLLAMRHWASSILQTLVFLFFKISRSQGCSNQMTKSNMMGLGLFLELVNIEEKKVSNLYRAKHNYFEEPSMDSFNNLKLIFFFKLIKGAPCQLPQAPCD